MIFGALDEIMVVIFFFSVDDAPSDFLKSVRVNQVSVLEVPLGDFCACLNRFIFL